MCAQNGVMIGFNSTKILRFLNFVLGLKLPIHANYRGFWDIFPPNGVALYSNPQNAPPYAETRRLSR